MTTEAPCRVLSSVALFRLITSFQRGVPAAIFHFWCAHAENATISVAERGQTFVKQLDQIPEFVAEHGDSQLLKLLPFVTETLPPRRWSRVCRVAAKKNDADMLQWAIDQGYLHTADALFVVVSLESSNSRALALMEKQRAVLARIAPQSLSTDQLYSEVQDVATIEWLLAHLPQLEWKWDCVAKSAALESRLEVLRYAYSRDASIKWESSLLTSDPLPSPECLRFLMGDHREEMVGSDLAHLLTVSSLEVLEIVTDFKHLYRKAVVNAILSAGENGKLAALDRFMSVGWVTREERVPIYRWKVTGATLSLLAHGLATDATMDRAAKAGAWDIVRYLHEHCSVRCSMRTMDAAVMQGRLDQVEYLHEQGVEGCSGSAVMNALSGGHHAVIEYLSTHYRHAFESKLDALLLHGEFAIWETLRSEHPAEVVETSISTAMGIAGNIYHPSTIHYILHTLGRSDLAHVALCGAADQRYTQWLAAVWRVIGPQSWTMETVRFVINRNSHFGLWDSTKFVIDNCLEPNAREQAITHARDTGWHQLGEELRGGWTRVSVDSIEIHPWLLDARTPKWVARRILEQAEEPKDDWYHRVRVVTWPIEAAYRRDLVVMAMAHDASRSTASSGADPQLCFDGACAAAVRVGHLPTLQWLLQHLDTPVESTLLDEALFYHRYEVAVWLATHCPEACTALEPRTRQKAGTHRGYGTTPLRYWLAKTRNNRKCGYDASLRQWLESEGEIVRQFIDIDSLPWENTGRAHAK